MSPNHQCAALAAAQARTGISYAQIAASIGSTEQQVIAICTGTQRPTESEFKAITRALGISDNVSHRGVHATV
ncbi:hypothetical protein K443DRAFT_681703 [Laccaria amethystina LaAM-08-1]|uniref:HTH cro/C1-type domain-containing protein n=1 Tax=Laccaria amethystina LaAM-08-1 TaxID=1095629 RepID=A0A0C9XHT5_9AGAR|nr:hypothetical protein K443DRAFT_681703 [Laccaria amethystina LaAM-08-1]